VSIGSKYPRYSNGQRFEYVDSNTIDGLLSEEAIHIRQKYTSLKHELIANWLTKGQYDTEYAKASIKYNLPIIRSAYFGVPQKTEFPWDPAKRDITLDIVLALLVYCNFDSVQCEFSKTFTENKDKHNDFYWMGKCVSEAIKFFSSPQSKQDTRTRYYRGINRVLAFRIVEEDACPLFCPISTTSCQIAALNFATSSGMVFTMSAQHAVNTFPNRGSFPVYLLSDFPAEREHLFLETYLSLEDIVLCHSGLSYQPTILAIRAMQAAMYNDSDYRNDDGLEVTDETVKQLMLNPASRDQYAEDLFQIFVSELDTACLDYHQGRFQFFYDVFCDIDQTNSECWNFELLHAWFPNVIRWKIKNASPSSAFLDSILKYLAAQTDCVYVQFYPKKKLTDSLGAFMKRVDFESRLSAIGYEVTMIGDGLLVCIGKKNSE